MSLQRHADYMARRSCVMHNVAARVDQARVMGDDNPFVSFCEAVGDYFAAHAKGQDCEGELEVVAAHCMATLERWMEERA